MSRKSDASVDHYRQILGVRFYVGPVEGLIERTMQGGLIVVPSAPVLVNLRADPDHRVAVETSDLAITDSGFMVLLWFLLKRERLIRISGLRYLRALLEDARFRHSGKILWIMPSERDDVENCAWLAQQGIRVADEDRYVAPVYARTGALADPALLALIEKRRPQFVMINLAGNVQERLGHYLREELKKRQPGSSDAEPPHMPALICTGAAIAFLSNRQVNIPPWADRLFLGWLMRILAEPTKFFPRYWRSLQLAALMWKHGSRSVAS